MFLEWHLKWMQERLGSISMIGVTISQEYKKRKHVFEISTPSRSRLLLQAKSEEEMLDWVRKIDASNFAKARVVLSKSTEASELRRALSSLQRDSDCTILNTCSYSHFFFNYCDKQRKGQR